MVLRDNLYRIIEGGLNSLFKKGFAYLLSGCIQGESPIVLSLLRVTLV